METEQYPNALGPDDDDEDSHFVQDISATASHHDHTEPDPSNYAHAAFGRQDLSIDPSLQQVHGSHYTQHQFPRQLYSELTRTAANQLQLQTPTEPRPSASPARFTSDSPASDTPKHPSYVPTDRSLPDKQAADETLDDAYCAFIFYCNPSVPLDCNTTDLRKAFRQPPKSDGKTFNTFRLLQLIGKFEEKEIKTWTNLAIELGVERNAESSAQKVQQYAVRLKRWMHAMHIDAFFEYMLNKPHNYYQQIPPPGSDSSPSSPDRARDGVPVEEDLALRALHPETRPKRGRRKTDDKDDGSEKDMPVSKRQHLEAPTPSTTDPSSAIDHFSQALFHDPHSAVPHSALPDGMDRFMASDQWAAAAQSVVGGAGNNSAVTPTAGQQFRWRAYDKANSVTTPQTASHASPNMANAHVNPQDTTVQDEATTPTIATPISAKARGRRRHGPAVSSAWPSSGNPTTGKLRGRPPSNRSVRDGPFSTFPANPTAKGHTIDLTPNTVTATPTSTPIVNHPPQFSFRPQQLHLTVPQRTGGNPITMASPASAVNTQINGEEWQRDKEPTIREPSDGPAILSFEEIERRFAVALLQAHQENTDIGMEEAKRIAEKAIGELKRTYTGSSGDGYGMTDERIALLTGCDTIEPGFRNLQLVKLPSELEELGLHDPDDDGDQNHIANRRRREQRYEVRWQTAFGPLLGEFVQRIILPPDQDEDYNDSGLTGFHGGHNAMLARSSGDDREGEAGDDSVDGLRRRVLELQSLLRERENEVKTIQSNVLRAVMR